MSPEARERAYDAQREWKRRNPEATRLQQRRYYLRKKYGVTLEWYDAKLAEQNGRCAICGSTDPGLWKDFVVDHDHETAKTRDLLCTFCNSALGMLRDDPALAMKAADYLRRHHQQRLEVI